MGNPKLIGKKAVRAETLLPTTFESRSPFSTGFTDGFQLLLDRLGNGGVGRTIYIIMVLFAVFLSSNIRGKRKTMEKENNHKSYWVISYHGLKRTHNPNTLADGARFVGIVFCRLYYNAVSYFSQLNQLVRPHFHEYYLARYSELN